MTTKDRCAKCKKEMHRMGANVCYPCNFKDGIEKGRADREKELAMLCTHEVCQKCKYLIGKRAEAKGRAEGIENITNDGLKELKRLSNLKVDYLTVVLRFDEWLRKQRKEAAARREVK